MQPNRDVCSTSGIHLKRCVHTENKPLPAVATPPAADRPYTGSTWRFLPACSLRGPFHSRIPQRASPPSWVLHHPSRLRSPVRAAFIITHSRSGRLAGRPGGLRSGG